MPVAACVVSVDSLQIKPLHSTITSEEQARVFDKAMPGTRKVREYLADNTTVM